jgi:hypothetical protein
MVTPRQRTIQQLTEQLRVGDLVFIRVPTPLFMQVADATSTWTNHVGVVIDATGAIAESRFAISSVTTFRRFVRRSAGGRVAVGRLRRALTTSERAQVATAARRRVGILYDTGFSLRSRRQFCSRYVREVIREASGEEVGTVLTFGELLRAQPQAKLWFWRLWYFGRIPWSRQTVTPASLLHSAAVTTVFDGAASN